MAKVQVIDRQIETKLKKDIDSAGYDYPELTESLRALLITATF